MDSSRIDAGLPSGPPETVDEYPPLTLGDFSRALARAGILDNRVVDLPGAVVALPYGVELLELFRARVQDIYRGHGLEEYEYPELVPMSSLRRTEQLLDLEGKLLLVRPSGYSDASTPQLALLPTGEAVIYGHWAKTVRARRDLPIRMYRRARYFRPVARGHHSGRGPFYSMEHDDIFEFHCAYGSSEELRYALRSQWELLDAAVKALHVPVLWSTRPPWTNRHEVAEWTIAADTPLPLRATTQVSALYNQGTRFSVPFGVGFRESGVMHHAFQLSGYVSRRLLLVHLLLGMTPSGAFRLHPDLAPVQLIVLAQAASSESATAARAIADACGQAGIRARRCVVDRSDRLTSSIEAWNARGVPLLVMILGSRNAQGALRIVVRHEYGNSEEETSFDDTSQIEGIVARCRDLLADVGAAWSWRATRFVNGRVIETSAIDETRDAVCARRVAVCPMVTEEAAVKAVAAWRAGEVLGFCHSADQRACIITGRPTETVALISPRT